MLFTPRALKLGRVLGRTLIVLASQREVKVADDVAAVHSQISAALGTQLPPVQLLEM